MIDGAGHPTILVRIFLPLSKAALATFLLFTFVFHWNTWFDGLVFIRDRSLRPLPTYLHTTLVQPNISEMDNVEREMFLNFNLRAVRAANIFVTTLPILVIYPFLQKHFTKGIRLGSVKE
jgi:putative aldouronate transport system permease protein